MAINLEPLKALLLVAESVRNSFVIAHCHGVPPAFINELGYFISIIQQLLLVQTSDIRESEQFDAAVAVIYQCYQTLESVSSRLTRAANVHGGDENRKSSLLRYYIKEEMKSEIEGLRDMISKNISAVNAMLSIRNITRSTSIDIADTGTKPRRRSSSAISLVGLDDPEAPLLPQSPSPKPNEHRPRRLSKAVRFKPIPELESPARTHPRQGPVGLSDAVVNIELLPNPYDLESQTPVQKPPTKGLHRPSISIIGWLISILGGLVFLLYYTIKRHDVNTGIGIMGVFLSVSTMVDQAVQWWHRRRAGHYERAPRS